MTTQNKYILGGVLALIAIIIITVALRSGSKPAVNEETNNTQNVVPKPGEETFSGTVSAVDTGCFADAVCSVTIDGKKIILVKGRMITGDTEPVGKLIGVDSVGDIEGKMGSFANVYAGRTPEGDYTLYGNSEYFVEIVRTSDK